MTMTRPIVISSRGGGGGGDEGWQRPQTWPSLRPLIVPSVQLILGITPDEQGQKFAFAPSVYSGNAIDIDWGDGTTSSHSTMGQPRIEHIYNYATLGAPADENGVKYVQVVAIAQWGTSLSSVMLNTFHSSFDTAHPTRVVSPIRELIICNNTYTYVTFSLWPVQNNYNSFAHLENIETTGGNLICNQAGCFSNMPALKQVKCEFHNGTDMSHLFENCYQLERIITPSGGMMFSHAKNNYSFMFYNCKALKEIPLMPTTFTANSADYSYMFAGCASLKSIPDLAFTGTNAKIPGLVEGCESLNKIKVTCNNAIQSATAFKNCYSLKDLEFICNSSAGTTLSDQIIDNSKSLERCIFTNWGYGIDLSNRLINRQALVDFFNAMGTAKTANRYITYSGTRAVGTLSAADKAIATDKGYLLNPA